VTPAFKFEQYQSASTYKKELLEKHPGISDFIEKLT
jgi:predicted cupin superfamily sugar epimerase